MAPYFYFFHFQTIFDSVPPINLFTFSRCRHRHNNAIANNGNPICTLITNPNTGIKQNAITAPSEEYPDVNATINHSIPQNKKVNGLVANNTPNIDEIPLPP